MRQVHGRRGAPPGSEIEGVCRTDTGEGAAFGFLGTALAETTELSSCIAHALWCRTTAVSQPRGLR